MPGTEIALSSCQYGCKVVRCDTCWALVVIHLQAYGHRTTTVQQSSTGARCTCPA
jgi:hypothetical protein